MKQLIFLLLFIFPFLSKAGDTIWVESKSDKRFLLYKDSLVSYFYNENMNKQYYDSVVACNSYKDLVVLRKKYNQHWGTPGPQDGNPPILIRKVFEGIYEYICWKSIVPYPSIVVKYKPQPTVTITPKKSKVTTVTTLPEKKRVKFIYKTNNTIDSSKTLIVNKDFQF